MRPRERKRAHSRSLSYLPASGLRSRTPDSQSTLSTPTIWSLMSTQHKKMKRTRAGSYSQGLWKKDDFAASLPTLLPLTFWKPLSVSLTWDTVPLPPNNAPWHSFIHSTQISWAPIPLKGLLCRAFQPKVQGQNKGRNRKANCKVNSPRSEAR